MFVKRYNFLANNAVERLLAGTNPSGKKISRMVGKEALVKIYEYFQKKKMFSLSIPDKRITTIIYVDWCGIGKCLGCFVA